MRREGYEFQVSKPMAVYKEIDGKIHEPMETVIIDVPEEFTGVVIEKLGKRKGELVNMENTMGGHVRLEFSIPSRGLFGYRSEFLTDTRGNGVMNSVFSGYQPYKGDIVSRPQGSLVAYETGKAVTYGLYNAQDRGVLFIEPGTMVYQGMVVGQHNRPGDIEVNVCKKKHVTNIRAAGADEALRLVPPKKLTLEQALEFIDDDELVEITPSTIRIRKKILDPNKRAKAINKKNKG
jgi:GTP-binding protein